MSFDVVYYNGKSGQILGYHDDMVLFLADHPCEELLPFRLLKANPIHVELLFYAKHYCLHKLNLALLEEMRFAIVAKHAIRHFASTTNRSYSSINTDTKLSYAELINKRHLWIKASHFSLKRGVVDEEVFTRRVQKVLDFQEAIEHMYAVAQEQLGLTSSL